jgi:NitT/TauT family transport system ATP-binding protein
LWRTVLANVTFGLEALGTKRDDARKQGLALLERVGLSEFADAYPRQLSGGMQQRVNLARALGVNPDLILLDEPFASLDAQTREAMQAYLNRVWSVESKSALLVTHQVDEAVYLADRVIVLSARPARIILDLRIPFDRPRDLKIKRDTRFRELEDTIWDALEMTVPSQSA